MSASVYGFDFGCCQFCYP